MKSIIFDDDDDVVESLFVKFAHPFCNHLFSPEALLGKRKNKKTIYYPGYHELAYLHPNYFKPDPKILEEVGLVFNERFFLLRFNAFKAYHDIGVKGLSLENKIQLVELLRQHGKIFITSENEIEPELKQYQIPITPDKIHSLLYYASIFLGDSQTMTSEAAILGTPALKCNTFAGKLSVPDELEKEYRLCYSYQPTDFEKFYLHINELLDQKDSLKPNWAIKRDKLLKEKIDVTSFFVWFIENYPKSVKIMKENPDFPNVFK